MIFFKLFKWDENIVVSNNKLDNSNNKLENSNKHIKLKFHKLKKYDFIDKILKDDPMFLSS